MQGRPVPWSAVTVVAGALVAASLYLTARGLAIAGDGSLYLVEIVAGEGFVGRSARMYASYVRQAPTVLAVHGGVTDLRALTLLLGFGQLVVLGLVWAAAVVLARPSRIAFALVALAAGLCAGSTWMFSVEEADLAAALTALVAVLLWVPRSWRLAETVLAVACAAVLVETHETTVFTSVPLVAWAALRARRAERLAERVACWGVSALAVATIVHGSVELHRQRDNPPAHDLVDAVRSLTPLELYVGLVAAIGLVALLFAPLGRWPRLVVFALTALAGIAALGGLLATDGEPYRARGGAMITTFLLELALLALWLRNRRGAPEPVARGAPALAVWLPVAVALVPIVALVPRAERWSMSLDAFRTEVNANHGVVPVLDVLPPGRRQVLFGWTSSSLSIVLRGRPDAAVLVDPAPTFVPFPPERAQAHIPARYTWR